MFRPALHSLLPAAALAAALLAALPATAQTDPNLERGFAPDKAYAFGDLDAVNLFNGNLTLAIPVGGTYSVNGGLTYGLALSYNSTVWDFEPATYKVNGDPVTYLKATPNRESNAGMGWTLSLGKVYPPNTLGSGHWRYLGPDGSEHVFYTTLHLGESSSSGVFYTRDGTYLRLKESSYDGGGNPLVAEVELPDGRIQRYTRTSGTGSFRLGVIKDRFGNQVSITYPTATRWQISDGHRTHYVNFVTRTNGDLVVSNVDLAAFGGSRAVYNFAYTEATISRSCLDDDPELLGGTPDTAAVNLLASVTAQADGAAFVFTAYNTTCFDGTTAIANLPGTLAAMTLPTLGRLQWTYQNYGFPTRGSCSPSGPGISISTVTGVKSKKVLNASGVCETWEGVGCEWTYAPSGSGGGRKTVVTLPNNDRVDHYFTQSIALSTATWSGWEYGLPIDPSAGDGSGRFLSQEIYDGATKKRSVYLRYEHDKLPSTTCDPEQWYNTNRRVASEKTQFHDDGGKIAEVTHSDFDGLGHYRTSTTSGSFGAGDVRSTTALTNPERGTYSLNAATNTTTGSYTAWPSARNWVLGTVQESSATEGGVTAKADFCHEGENTNTLNGFLLRKRVMKGTTAGANDVVTRFVRDAAGNVTEEHSYGGDTQGLGTTADLCALALPGDQYFVRHTYASGSRATSKWQTSGGVALGGGTILDRTIDAGTGLPSAVRDAAGVQTNLTHDALGRLTWAKPTTGNGAWTEYRWTRATSASATAKVHVFQRANGATTGAGLAESRIYFDPHGRLWRDQVLGANGAWSTVDTVHNSMGWKRSVTERQPVAPTRWTLFKDFDPFGRPGTIVPPDGTGHQVTLTYLGTRQVKRTVKVNSGAAQVDAVTTEQYDRQGRLWKVIEPSGTGGANVTTTYGYDVGSRLKSVATSGQTRTFTYDNRGFLNWERHPEKGASGNGYVRYLNYDALGNPGRKLDAVGSATSTSGAASDLTFTYDRAARLTQVRESTGSLRTLKVFVYATANSGSSKQAGKLITADRYNYVFIGTTPFTVQVRESYVYAAVGGAVSSRATQVYVNGGAQEAFTQSWVLNDLGDPSTVTHPRCTHAGCNGGALTSRNVSFTYTRGFLTAVPTFASSIAYHPNGMVSTVDHTNGVTYTQAADPDGMRRPASYATTWAASNWSSGTYAYDGAGNVTAIGLSSFVYDPVSRLTSSSVRIGLAGFGATENQSAVYDLQGNLIRLITDVPGTTLVDTVELATSTSTNRLTGASTYDSSGSMTSWNGNTYESDGFGMIWRATLSGVQYHHFYTADDERIWTFQQGAPSRWTVRDLDGKVLRELKNNAGTWSVERDYVHRDGTLLAAVVPGPETWHFHPDHLGSPRLITGAAARKVSYHVYHPFGREATAFNQDTERMKFTGHERDLGNTSSTADDLDYMHARFYNMEIGRFLSVDPVTGHPLKPQSWNRYTYAMDNPLVYVDEDGRSAVKYLVKTSRKVYREVKRSHAARVLAKGENVKVVGPGAGPAAKRLGKEVYGKKNVVRHGPHKEGWLPHFQKRSGGGGHIFYDNLAKGVSWGAALGSLAGQTVEAATGLEEAGRAAEVFVDFFNPVSDIEETASFLDEIATDILEAAYGVELDDEDEDANLEEPLRARPSDAFAGTGFCSADNICH